MRKIWLIGLLFLLVAVPARADEYEKPSLSNFMKTLIRFGAVDLRRDDIIDAYGRVSECKIYFEFYKDDFKWQKVRQALRESIKQNIATFPVAYQYDAVLQLERYDFRERLYRFTAKTAQASSNVFSILTQKEEFCTDTDHSFPPMIYKFVLDRPLKMLGIPIGPDIGQRLLERMDAANNKDRLVYARFKFRITYIAPLNVKKPKTALPDNREKTPSGYGPMVVQDIKDDEVMMDSRVDSIEYYEDPARTKLIYSYTP